MCLCSFCPDASFLLDSSLIEKARGSCSSSTDLLHSFSTGLVLKSLLLLLQMSDPDSSSSSSQAAADLMDEELESEEGKSRKENGSPTPSLSGFASLRAVMRIKHKYQAMKKRRQEMALGPGAPGDITGAPGRTSPKIFTFDGATPNTFPAFPFVPQKKKRKRKKRVLFPNDVGRKTAPKPERSRATYCLYLLFVIVFVQVNRGQLPV